MYTHLSLTLLLPPHETMVRSHMLSVGPGRAEPEPGPPSSQSASEAQLHVSAHMGEEAGSAGRSRRSLHTRRPGPPSLERESVEV